MLIEHVRSFIWTHLTRQTYVLVEKPTRLEPKVIFFIFVLVAY